MKRKLSSVKNQKIKHITCKVTYSIDYLQSGPSAKLPDDGFRLKYSYSHTVCTRPECIRAANRLLEGMNTSVDPCEDFYEYVCGNWEHSHSTSYDINSWFIERLKVLNNEIKNILKEKHSVLDSKPVSKMKEFYRMCTDTGYLNSKGFQPLYDVLDLLGLPRTLPYPGISDDFNIAKVLAMSQKLLDLDIFIQLSTHFNDTLNTTFLIIGPAITKTSLVRTKQKPFKMKAVSPREFLRHQVKYMTDVMKEFTPDVNVDDISQAAMGIVLYDAQLNLVLGKENNSLFKGRFFSFNELETYMFHGNQNQDLPFSWQDYVSTLTRGSNVSLQMNDTIIIVNHRYFRALGIDLMTFKRIDLQRHIWWKIIDYLAIHTTDQMRNYKFVLYERVYDGINKYSRSLDCISLVKSSFPEVLTHVFAKQNISNSVTKIENVLSRIKHSLQQMIKNSAWLDLRTKAASIKKVDEVEVFIGYPNKSLNLTWLTERYENVDIISDDFMSSLINIHSVSTARIINVVNGPYGYELDNNSFLVDYHQINSFYQRELNYMYILSGILQYPFFMDGVESLNYGAVGFILGHELMHGFDREGIRHYWNGYEAKTWNPNMIEAFNQHTKCFVKQYQQYYIMDNKTIDGNRTLSENLADNEGLRLALHAYQDYVTENGAEPVLPAFENFSHQQLLFMSFANVYCIKENESYKKYMLDDAHSNHKNRIIGTLSNMPEFAESWNCRPNVPMNPSNKCSFW